ncbi:MAG: lipase secretion chaperone [Acidobacteriota bacterium]
MTNKILLQSSHRKTKAAWAVAACVGATLALLLTQYREHSHDAPRAAPSESTQAAIGGHEWTRSFQGTTPDGQLSSSTGRDLVLSPDLIRRFEYHLTAVGEKTQAQIRAAILADIAAELNDKGQKEAQRILDAYLKFKTALGSVAQPRMTEINGTALAQHFKSIRDLRALYFQPSEIQALFGNTDEYDDYTARKLAIVQNKGLSATEREAQLTRLKDTLSPENRANIEQPVIHLTLAAREEQARREGATPEAIQQIRTNLVGADAAKRLAALDQEEAAWKARIQQYKAALAADPSQAQQLRGTLFTPQEQLRLAAYE